MNLKMQNIQNKIQEKVAIAKFKVSNFLKDETSDNQQASQGWLTWQSLAIGVGVLTIMLVAYVLVANNLGNFFADGVQGDVDKAGLSKWGDKVTEFNRK